MPVTIVREAATTPNALRLLEARDAESNALYPPESQFHIPIDGHSTEDVIFLVAREGDVAIGCGALQLHDGYAELKSIYVTPGARGRKLGADIVRALEAVAANLGIGDLKLETGVHSPAAIATYERLGYRRRGRFGDYPDEPLSVFMEKRLGPGYSSSDFAARELCARRPDTAIEGDPP
jgi:putative acetyltransferase